MAGSLHGPDDLPENHEINVTPFIDVMLVLLIIFMVAAPLATVDINVDLPASSGVAAQRPEQPLWLTLGPDLNLSVGDDPVAPGDLIGALDRASEGDREARIFLRADQSVSYGEVMAVMNRLRDGGWTRIALVGIEAQPATPTPTGGPAPE